MKKFLISHRTCHLAEVKSKDLDRIVEEIKSFLEGAEIPYLLSILCLGIHEAKP